MAAPVPPIPPVMHAGLQPADAKQAPEPRHPRHEPGNRSQAPIVYRPLRTKRTGADLLEKPHLNKGSAFTRTERATFKLSSYLPYEVQSLDVQIGRATAQLDRHKTNIGKRTFLVSLREQNTVLFFALLERNLKELLPILYTPTVGEAIKQWSELFRRPAYECYLSLPYFESDPWALPARLAMHNPEIYDGDRPYEFDLIICTDGEGILGIGDWGVHGTEICVAKGNVYTLGAGIAPPRILSVVLDMGTNNQQLLDHPLYMGWRHPRVQGERYDTLVDAFVKSVQALWPRALIHFEDFGKANAARLLDKYRNQFPVFNDDIQGTGAVVLAALLGAVGAQKSKLSDQRVLIYGAGTAGTGVAQYIRLAMVELDGLSREDAESRIWLVDRKGLLTASTPDVSEHQRPYAEKHHETVPKEGGLVEYVRVVKPTVMIGTSGQGGAWTEDVVKRVMEGLQEGRRPILMPLSNPTELSEAKPEDLFKWTNGQVLTATGSPFPPVKHPRTGREVPIASANNALIYPGLALGTILSSAPRLSDRLILAGVRGLASLSPALRDPEHGPVLPDLAHVRKVSVSVAAAVAGEQDGESVPKGKEEREEWVSERMWNPEYKPLEYIET